MFGRIAWDRRAVGRYAHRHLAFSRWVFPSLLLQIFQTNFLFFLVPRFFGEETVGLLRVAENLKNITNVVLIGLQNYVPPRAAACFSRDGYAALQQFVFKIGIVGVAPLILFTLVMIVFGEPILAVLFGDPYRAAYAYLIIFCIARVLGFVGECYSFMLLSIEMTRAFFWNHLVGFVLVLGAGIGAMPILGPLTVPLVFTVKALVNIVVQGWFLRGYRRRTVLVGRLR